MIIMGIIIIENFAFIKFSTIIMIYEKTKESNKEIGQKRL